VRLRPEDHAAIDNRARSGYHHDGNLVSSYAITIAHSGTNPNNDRAHAELQLQESC